jgi:hypothetical protein
LGILFDVHRSPIDRDGNAQIQVGFNLAHGTDILHQSNWGVVEEVVVLTPPRCGSLPLVGKWHKSIVAKFTGDKDNAVDLMEVVAKAWATH